MNITRRRFLETGSMAAVSLGSIDLSAKRFSAGNLQDKGPDILQESYVLPFASKGVEAALAAGASYADVRIIRTVTQGFKFREDKIGAPEGGDMESIGFGVRALVNGCFGFAASPYIDLEEATILAKAAVEQAKANSAIRPRTLIWPRVPAQKGRWVSPGEDPFLVPLEERIEFINAWREDVQRYRDGANATKLLENGASFERTEKFLVTSDGTQVSQVLYASGGYMNFAAFPRFHQPLTGPHIGGIRGIDMQQGGWEVFKKANPRNQIPKLVANAIEASKVGMGLFDVGRYDLVLDGSFVGSLVSRTFGRSTQLDVALGYEANAGGTSYLGPDPSEFLGTKVAHPLVSIKCDRSGTAKLSTVKWDDEGVVPNDFDLVQNGTLVNYQASRETSARLNDWLKKSEPALQGCAQAQSGLNLPIQSAPNLSMTPNPSPCSLDEMISNVKRGYVVYGGEVGTTFNVRDGFGTPGLVREIRDGKLKDFIPQIEIMFSTPEIWKNIAAVGDSTTVRRSRGWETKGEPSQGLRHSVDAVAITAKDVALIDPKRKA